MGKRFEGEHPTFQNVLEAYRLLGIDDMMGSPGTYTAFASKFDWMSETIEFSTIPGDFSAAEIEQLLRDAGIQAEPARISQAA